MKRTVCTAQGACGTYRQVHLATVPTTCQRGKSDKTDRLLMGVHGTSTAVNVPHAPASRLWRTSADPTKSPADHSPAT